MSTNQSVLKETSDVQHKTLAALRRTRHQVEESKEVGTATLEQLEDHEQRIQKSKKKTSVLLDALKKTEKTQNRFAFLSGHWKNTTSKKAQKEVQKEEEEKAKAAEEVPKTFKRRGPRPKKTEGIGGDGDGNVDKGTKNELFNNAKQEKKKSSSSFTNSGSIKNEPKMTTSTVSSLSLKKKSKSKKNNAKNTHKTTQKHEDVPLTEEDQKELNTIHDMDQLVDEEIDALGDQVNDLLALSQSIGQKATTQTTQLGTIQTNLHQTNTRTKVINKRMKFFTGGIHSGK